MIPAIRWFPHPGTAKPLGLLIRQIPYCVGAFLACALLLTPFIVLMLMLRDFLSESKAQAPTTCVHNFHPAYPDDRCPDCRAWYGD